MAVATWVGYPRSYSKGRNRPPQYIVVHYTAGSEGPTSAENGAAYDKVRTDGTSTHVFADSNSVVREVPDGDRAHAALFHGNEIGLQLEICGTAQTRAQWLDPVSSATLRMAAKQCVEWCRDHGIPVRRLTVDETRAAWYNPAGSRPKGFAGHVDVTNAYPEDGGDHTDPGAAFPWDVFLAMVQEELGGGAEMTPTEHEWLETTAWRLTLLQSGDSFFPDSDIVPAQLRGKNMWAVSELKRHAQALGRIEAALARIEAKLATLTQAGVDVDALVADLIASDAYKALLVVTSEEGAQNAEKR